MAKRISPEIEADIVAAILRGDCAFKISRHFSVDQATVVRVARRNSVEVTRGERRPDIERLRQIHDADQRYGRQQAAAMFQIQPSSVSNAVRRFYAATDKGVR